MAELLWHPIQYTPTNTSHGHGKTTLVGGFHGFEGITTVIHCPLSDQRVRSMVSLIDPIHASSGRKSPRSGRRLDGHFPYASEVLAGSIRGRTRKDRAPGAPGRRRPDAGS